MVEDAEVFEIWLDDKMIDTFIDKLKELKDQGEHVHFDDKKNNHVILVHEETEIM